MNNHFSNNDINHGLVSILSMFSASFAMITMDNVHQILSMIGSAVAIISGYFSARYFYKQGKKI